MRTCNCGNKTKPTPQNTLGSVMGLILYNCEKCNTTLSKRTVYYPIYKTTVKALSMMKEIKNRS